MSKLLRSFTDTAIASATGTSAQQISSMRNYGKQLKEKQKSAEEELKAAKASGDKETIKKAKETKKTVDNVAGEVKTSKMLTLIGAGNSSFSQQALQNARSVLQNQPGAVVDQTIVNTVASMGQKKERELPVLNQSIQSAVSKGLGLGE